MSKLIAETFHKQHLQGLVAARRKRIETRILGFVCFLAGVAVGVTITDTSNRIEMDRMQRAFIAQEDR